MEYIKGFFDAAFGLAQNDNVGNAEETIGDGSFRFKDAARALQGGARETVPLWGICRRQK